ncbi:RNA-directed DNA polymerase, eukaryota, reverse transcriptase zinc-binding domain protein [Tanacetum coccineum]
MQSVNVIPKSMFERLKLAKLKKTDMLVEMADMTKISPIGIVKNVLVKIDKFLFLSYFVVMDMLNTCNETMLLGRPFLATIHAEIDVFNKEISLGIGESPSLSSTPSDKSSRFGKSNNLQNNYDNHIRERRSKKTRILKSNTNLPSTHFCKPVKQICNGILKVWPTCDPTLKACNGGIEVYGINEEGNLKRWYCYLDVDRGSIKGGGLSFPEFLLVKYREVQKKELIWDNRLVIEKEVDQLADEYELGTGKKGHMLDDIWENCKKVQGDNTYWWHDQKSEEEERRELGINIEEYAHQWSM